ncbi:uncharacterized protein N7515_009492 [Penicillium bovifimosum]|uniref:Uncharacterized protein n=1 Tax=Penicillium bovifimosum TaxID=126998 RepID=A0A9W9GJQ6_9EURO|nr:uncharacterized protein N7515_009492 [Penicillium bovifimosum]KAJ5121531.1 hypothetical protein N7515_009492 [Penicillium bovifimosum]
MTPKPKPAMNPTVEDENDSHDTNSKANTPIPWSEIFSRHSVMIGTHLDFLRKAEGQTISESDGQLVLSMFDTTVRALSDLWVVQKIIMSRNTTTSSTSIPSNPSNPAHSTDSETNTRKKRRRVSREKESIRPGPEYELRASKRSRDTSFQAPAQEDDYTTSTSLGRDDISREEESTRSGPDYTLRASKRSRDTSFQAPAQEDDYTTSTSLGTEDISAEVQRRLRIKEEKRRKKENPKPDKRKRESLVSNDGASAAVNRPRTKRLKVEHVRKRESDLEPENGTDSLKAKRASRH